MPPMRLGVRAGLLLAAAVLLLPARANAANCSISTTSVAFGTYNVFSASPLDSTGTVTIQCTGNANVQINLDKGGAATFAGRRMLKGSEPLSYNLYTDAARTLIWGDGTSGTSTYTQNGVPNNTPVTVTIYGQVPADQDVTAGSYSNTVTAVVNF